METIEIELRNKLIYCTQLSIFPLIDSELNIIFKREIKIVSLKRSISFHKSFEVISFLVQKEEIFIFSSQFFNISLLIDSFLISFCEFSFGISSLNCIAMYFCSWTCLIAYPLSSMEFSAQQISFRLLPTHWTQTFLFVQVFSLFLPPFFSSFRLCIFIVQQPIWLVLLKTKHFRR